MKFQASLQQPDKPLNLKLVMNPEGKLHDWTDLPEEEIPELQQVATGGMNPEAARQMLENLQACKGKGKMREKSENLQPSNKNGYQTKSNPPNIQSSFGAMTASGWPAQNGKTFQSSYAEVFKNRKGIFEQGNAYMPKTFKTMDDLSLPVPKVSSLSKQTKSVTKPKGSRVQFDDNKENDDNDNIANHYGKRVSESKANSDTKSLISKNVINTNNITNHTETNNPEISHTPMWQPLSRSRTAPDLVSAPKSFSSIRSFFDDKHNDNTKEKNKVNINHRKKQFFIFLFFWVE